MICFSALIKPKYTKGGYNKRVCGESGLHMEKGSVREETKKTQRRRSV